MQDYSSLDTTADIVHQPGPTARQNGSDERTLNNTNQKRIEDVQMSDCAKRAKAHSLILRSPLAFLLILSRI